VREVHRHLGFKTLVVLLGEAQPQQLAQRQAVGANPQLAAAGHLGVDARQVETHAGR
jgi:hypothetical protein